MARGEWALISRHPWLFGYCDVLYDGFHVLACPMDVSNSLRIDGQFADSNLVVYLGNKML
jgi:hypothetical protein